MRRGVRRRASYVRASTGTEKGNGDGVNFGDMNDSIRAIAKRLTDAANHVWTDNPSGHPGGLPSKQSAVANRLDAIRDARAALEEIIDNAPLPEGRPPTPESV